MELSSPLPGKYEYISQLATSTANNGDMEPMRVFAFTLMRLCKILPNLPWDVVESSEFLDCHHNHSLFQVRNSSNQVWLLVMVMTRYPSRVEASKFRNSARDKGYKYGFIVCPENVIVYDDMVDTFDGYDEMVDAYVLSTTKHTDLELLVSFTNGWLGDSVVI